MNGHHAAEAVRSVRHPVGDGLSLPFSTHAIPGMLETAQHFSSRRPPTGPRTRRDGAERDEARRDYAVGDDAE